jgi:signal transduction histidine kinase
MREFARNKSREFLAAAKDARRRTLQFGWLGLAGSVILAWFIMRKAVRLESDLQELNLGLDQKVRQRTAELATANENLAVQYEEIATMNEELTAQHEEITALNEDLEQRVEQRTADLSSANVELERKNEEMSRFVYTVSHDLRSPLVTIKAFLGYLEQDIKEKQTEAADKDMVYIRNAADKMAVLLDELLKLSRIGSKGNLKAEISLQTLAGEVLDLLAGRISGRGVRVSVTEEPVVVYGDIARLTELYQNLIDNAVKFMGDQTDPVIEIGARQEPTGITLYVRDNGSGIDPRHQKKLFGLFEKLDTLTEGVGMGLAIARRVVELHEGTIWVESGGAGTGATFYFKLARTRIGKSEGGSA